MSIIPKRLLIAIKCGDVKRFYASKEWIIKRAKILRRDNNECQSHKRQGKYAKATCVHHKKHLRDYPELALDDDNLESLCDACHNIEHPEKFFNEVKPKFTNEERWE